MIQFLANKITTFEEFIEGLPEDRCYELHEGTIVEMQPTGQHEDIAGFLTQELTLEYTRMNLPYRIPPKALVKVPNVEFVLLDNLNNPHYRFING